MKRFLAALMVTLTCALCMALPQTVAAVDVLEPACQGSAANSAPCKDNQASATDNPIFGPNGIVTIILKWLARIVGIVCVIVIIAAGIQLTVSGGDTNASATARRSITYAAIGLVIALFAQAIVSFVLSKL